jgi:hypothetical protein
MRHTHVAGLSEFASTLKMPSELVSPVALMFEIRQERPRRAVTIESRSAPEGSKQNRRRCSGMELYSTYTEHGIWMSSSPVNVGTLTSGHRTGGGLFSRLIGSIAWPVYTANGKCTLKGSHVVGSRTVEWKQLVYPSRGGASSRAKSLLIHSNPITLAFFL